MRDKTNSSLSGPVDPAFQDDEVTQPISLALIARLAAKDPTVQLKVGVLEWGSDLQIGENEEKPE